MVNNHTLVKEKITSSCRKGLISETSVSWTGSFHTGSDDITEVAVYSLITRFIANRNSIYLSVTSSSSSSVFVILLLLNNTTTDGYYMILPVGVLGI